MLNEESYLGKRSEGWQRLETLVSKAESSFRRLSGLEVIEYVRLYRQTSADLAFLMTHSSNADVVEHLNRLVGRAYAQLYRAPEKTFLQGFLDGLYFSAKTFRKHQRLFWLSFGILMAGFLFSFAVMSARPDLRHHFVPAAAEANHESWMEGKFDPRSGGEGMLMTAFYASNNPRAGMMSASIGAATAGIGTTYVLWTNGLGTGALAADMASVGLLHYLFFSIAPHGVSEIGGFLVASAVGFVFAIAILCPGRRTRSLALKDAGKEGFTLFVTALIMIALAAPIEGFFSFNPFVPLWLKALAAVIAFTAWTLFFTRYGLARERAEIAAETEIVHKGI